MPIPYPKEFRRDVIAVARQGDRTLIDVPKSFGISQTCLTRWSRIAEREDNPPAGSASTSSEPEAENQALRKRTKQLKQENEILRRATAYFARDVLPDDVPAGP